MAKKKKKGGKKKKKKGPKVDPYKMLPTLPVPILQGLTVLPERKTQKGCTCYNNTKDMIQEVEDYKSKEHYVPKHCPIHRSLEFYERRPSPRAFAESSVNRLRKRLPADIDQLGPPVTTKIDPDMCREMISQYTTLIMRHELLEHGELADIFLRRSTLFSCLGDHASALADAEQCIGLRSEVAAAYYRAGHACFKLHTYEKSTRYFQLGMKHSPGSQQMAVAFRYAMQELNTRESGGMTGDFQAESRLRRSNQELRESYSR
jgi:hypothetical protein